MSTLDPYTGPTSLDAYLDRLRDPLADEAPEPEGAPAFVCTRPARAAAPRAPSPATARTKKEQGVIDRRKLQAALADPDLKERPRSDFEEMLGKIEPQFGDYDCLTDRQRGYVQNVLDELGIDERTPAERNASVPRGRNVELSFGQLPLAPPGRTPPAAPGKLARTNFDPELCALQAARRAAGGRLGSTVDACAVEKNCLHCGGLCPRA